MADNHHLQRLNSLFDKLKISPTDNAAKTKFKHIQNTVGAFTLQVEKICEDKQLKIQFLTDRLHKLQSMINEDIIKREEREQSLSSKIVKVEKSCFKIIDNFTKDRSEMDRRLQSSVEACLSQINNYKLRTQSECMGSIKQIEDYLPEIDQMIRDVENEAALTKEILKKIYNQFVQQIQELRLMIAQEKSERQAQEQQVVTRLQEIYHSIHKRIVGLKATRDKSQKMLVDLLERVIDKVKREIAGC